MITMVLVALAEEMHAVEVVVRAVPQLQDRGVVRVLVPERVAPHAHWVRRVLRPVPPALQELATGKSSSQRLFAFRKHRIYNVIQISNDRDFSLIDNCTPVMYLYLIIAGKLWVYMYFANIDLQVIIESALHSRNA